MIVVPVVAAARGHVNPDISQIRATIAQDFVSQANFAMGQQTNEGARNLLVPFGYVAYRCGAVAASSGCLLSLSSRGDPKTWRPVRFGCDPSPP
jgi:hypothetical protein